MNILQVLRTLDGPTSPSGLFQYMLVESLACLLNCLPIMEGFVLVYVEALHWLWTIAICSWYILDLYDEIFYQSCHIKDLGAWCSIQRALCALFLAKPYCIYHASFLSIKTFLTWVHSRLRQHALIQLMIMELVLQTWLVFKKSRALPFIPIILHSEHALC